MKRYAARLIFALGIYIIIGGLSLRSFAREASYLLDHPVKQSFLTFLADTELLVPEQVRMIYLSERHIAVSQPGAEKLYSVYLTLNPTKEEIDQTRRFFAEIEPVGSLLGLVERQGIMLVHEPYTQAIRDLLVNFTGADYPARAEGTALALRRIANNPAERLQQSSAHRLFDVLILRFLGSIAVALGGPWRQWAAARVGADPAALRCMASYQIAGLGALLTAMACRTAFPRRPKPANPAD